MNNDYNLKDIEILKDNDKKISYEINQFIKCVIHSILIGSSISFIIGSLLFVF